MDSSYPFVSIDYYSELATHRIIKSDDVFPSLEPNSILFIKTEHITKYIFNLINVKIPYTLITSSNTDVCSPYFTYPASSDKIEFIFLLILKNPYLKRWYSKNVCIDHPKIFPIPIGPKWQWESTEMYGEDKAEKLTLYKKYFLEPQILFNEEKPKLLYINMAVTATREPFYRDHNHIRAYAFAELFRIGFEISRETDLETYIKDIKSHKFCISPPGKGIDAHRTWDSLMLGTIPICLSSPIDSLYEDLPVLIVKDYNIVTEKYLLEQYDIMKKKTYNFNKLYADYWKNEITSCA